MNQLALVDVLTGLRELPSLPTVIHELIASFGQQDVSIAELAAKVGQDQALTAKTLRLANSSFYGLQSKVRTIDQAISVLGFDSVRSLVSASGIIDTCSQAGGAGFDFHAFWRHAIATAVCARSVAQASGCNRESAFIAGLLHDIGRLALATRFPGPYAAAIAHAAADDCGMLEAERCVLGPDHAIVGRALAHQWRFPLLIQHAIGNHHAPPREDRGTIACVVHTANALVHALDLNGEGGEPVPPIDIDAWDSLHLDGRALRLVFEQTEAEFEEACQILTA